MHQWGAMQPVVEARAGRVPGWIEENCSHIGENPGVFPPVLDYVGSLQKKVQMLELRCSIREGWTQG